MSTPTPPRRRTSILAALVLIATAGLAPAPPALAALPTTDYVARCTLDLKSSPVAVATAAYAAAVTVASIRAGTGISAQPAVVGDAWSLACGSSTYAGTSWYPITAISGTPVGNLYAGRTVVYAPTALFRSSPGYLEGIDVSHWQGTIDWPTVAGKGGKKFAFMKATEDTNFVDSQYRTNHAAARAVGIRTGAYHFAQPSTSTVDAIAQADWFVAHIGLTAGDLFPVLDLETRNGLTDAQLISWVQAFMNEVYVKTGIKGIIYVSPSFWSSYMNDTTWFAANGYTVLWIAHWFVSSPRTPGSNWGGKGWTFWQYSDCGKVPGIGSGKSCVDLDRYNGLDMTRVTYAPDFGVGVTSATSQLPTSTGGSTPSTTTGASASTPPGGTAAYSLAISRRYFTLPIDFDVAGLPDGARASWSVDPATGTATVLSIETSVDGAVTPPGTYPLTITGSATLLNSITGEADLISRSATATLQVAAPDFSVAPAVAALAGPTKQGASASWKVTIARRFVDSPIDLSIDGLPPGTAATFTPEAIAAGGTTGTLTVVTTRDGSTPAGQFPATTTDAVSGETSGGPVAGPTPVGSFPLTLTAVGTAPEGAGGGDINHTLTVTLVVSDGIAPTVSMPTSRLYAVTTPSSSSTPVRTSWGGSDPSGVKSFALQRQVDGGAWSTIPLSSATATSIVQSLSYGHAYRYRVRATDRNGNVSGWSYGLVQRPMLTQQTSTMVTWSSGYWSTASSSSYLGSSSRYTNHRGSWASFRATGSSFAWVADRGPNRGQAGVYVDDVLVATVNLYASTYQARRTVWAVTFPAGGSHTIKIVDLGTSGHPRIDIDAFIRLANS
jgi:GH25 family lysozyme M1 (1,4-beta-N-acetylmuramidase)